MINLNLNNSGLKNNELYSNQRNTLTYLYNDNLKSLDSRNNNSIYVNNDKKMNMKDDYFNFDYSNYPTEIRTNKKNAIINSINETNDKNKAYTPKTYELRTINIDINKTYEESKEKYNAKKGKNKDKLSDKERIKNYELYISSLNNQIYKLESQIEKLQNKVIELNSYNISVKKDHYKLKDYEKLIQIEKCKSKDAENMIMKLRQEIDNLQKSNQNTYTYTNNNHPNIIKYRSFHSNTNSNNNKTRLKKTTFRNLCINQQTSVEKTAKTSESENENLNKFINDLHIQVDKFNDDLNDNMNDI
jgi:flagellar biosynthesis chaperone FliJ